MNTVAELERMDALVMEKRQDAIRRQAAAMYECNSLFDEHKSLQKQIAIAASESVVDIGDIVEDLNAKAPYTHWEVVGIHWFECEAKFAARCKSTIANADGTYTTNGFDGDELEEGFRIIRKLQLAQAA